jgi:hypothetical protein
MGLRLRKRENWLALRCVATGNATPCVGAGAVLRLEGWDGRSTTSPKMVVSGGSGYEDVPGFDVAWSVIMLSVRPMVSTKPQRPLEVSEMPKVEDVCGV